MFKLLPTRLSPSQSWPGVVPAKGEKRARVGLLLGCVQQVLEPDINTATIDVLCRNGVEVIIPPEQGCCGGLAWHNGQLGAAQTFARDNMRAFEGVDAIVTNAAGCGSTMQEYHLILAGTPEQPAAEIFRHRVIDVSVFLARLGLRPMSAQNPRRVAYQDACHLAHAQGVSLEPRSLLKAIPGTTLVELAGAQLCCGSAGTYNLDQPQIAGSLGQKKAEAIAKSGARLVVSGNIGCINQLRAHLALIGSEIPVRHIMQELRDAYIGMPD